MKGMKLGQMDGSAGKGIANELYNHRAVPRTHMCKKRTYSCKHSSSLYTHSVTKLMTEKDYLE